MDVSCWKIRFKHVSAQIIVSWGTYTLSTIIVPTRFFGVGRQTNNPLGPVPAHPWDTPDNAIPVGKLVHMCTQLRISTLSLVTKVFAS